eukprot:5815551-Amphidinium_carterae.1
MLTEKPGFGKRDEFVFGTVAKAKVVRENCGTTKRDVRLKVQSVRTLQGQTGICWHLRQTRVHRIAMEEHPIGMQQRPVANKRVAKSQDVQCRLLCQDTVALPTLLH